MSKKLLAQIVKAETLCTNSDAKEAVNAIIAAIIKGTKTGKGKFNIRGFGVFSAKVTRSRKARNPRTGEVVNVPAKATIKFTPSTVLVQRIKG